MNSAAARPSMRYDAVPSHPRGALIGSIIFHVIIILLAVFGLPFIHHTPPVESTPLSVELVNPSDMTHTTRPPMRAPTKQPPLVQKPTPPQPAPTPPQVVKPAQPTPPQPPQPPQPVQEKTPPPPDELAPPKKTPPPKPVKTPKPVTAKPDTPTKDVSKAEQQDFNSLLKNLVPAKPTTAATPDAPTTADKPAPDAPVAASMSSDELDALRRQLAECWNLMAGSRDAESLVVDVRLSVNADRTVRAASVVDQMKYNTDPYFRAAGDSALRAVHDPHCAVLELPPDKYALWKEITVTFDPSEMLQ